MISTWLVSLVRTRTGIIFGTVGGIAVTVGLIVALGSFMLSSASQMTARASGNVPIDWQVQLVPGTPQNTVRNAMGAAVQVSKAALVGYASVNGFEASAGGTVQVTGAGKVLGLPPSYAAEFPGNIRPLVGSSKPGVLVAQQTAANLHVVPGDSVVIHRPGLADATVTIDGVVDLPNADSMFQGVGLPPNAAPQAPPDNVLILPMAQWHSLFDQQTQVRPDSIRIQIHARLDHAHLPHDPQAAYLLTTSQGHNFEARVAGNALLSNNLAAVLGKAREDASYARILFFFLGTPGIAIAVLLTFAVAHAGAWRRRRDQSLLRLRGASSALLTRIAASEALAVGIVGSLIGVAIGELTSLALFSTTLFSAEQVVWIGIAAGIGVLLSLAAVLLPAWWDARNVTITAGRAFLAAERPPLWARSYLDLVLLALAGIIFWRTAATGYQIVLAPEGVAAISVDYWSFLAPLLFWLGMGLLLLRVTRVSLTRGRAVLTGGVRLVSGSFAPLVAGALARQPKRIAAGSALTGLAIAFAVSTAIFNATYQAQSRVDAELTNGADVTVTGTPSAPAGQTLDKLKAVKGVTAAVAMQHRLAYVGTDLQDLYGIDPATVDQATTMSNAYFANGDWRATLAALRNTPDGVLVSQETVNDFQLAPGDTINLRLQNAADNQYHVVHFRFVGVTREFPTAPKDSFLVANAQYIASVTGNLSREVVLLKTAGSPTVVHDRVAAVVKDLPGVKVSDINQAAHLIGSSLTAVDLGGLTKLELGYAVLLSGCAAGLVLALGVLDRRRSFAIMSVLGARPRQLLAFLRGEAALILVVGAISGAITGSVVSWMLVKLLTGVFDPPPESLNVPWLYIGAVLATTIASVILAVAIAGRRVERSPIAVLRETA